MQKKNKKGFTIVELVVVIAVIGILSAILIPTFMGLSDNARKQAIQSDLSSIYTQYAVEAADGVVDATGDKIDILNQEQVVIAYKEAQYKFDKTENKWTALTTEIDVEEGKNLHSLVYTGSDSYIDHDAEGYPTFAGYKVYKLATNPQQSAQDPQPQP